VSAQYLRLLEWQGKIPLASRDFNGRYYTEADVELLRAMGVGQRHCPEVRSSRKSAQHRSNTYGRPGLSSAALGYYRASWARKRPMASTATHSMVA
jgi:hypothetical protein